MKASIRIKITVVLASIFIVSYIMSIMLIGSSIRKNNEEIISKDIEKHVYNLNIYIKQYLHNSSIEEDSVGFEQNSRDIGFLLSSKYNQRIIIYNVKGQFLYDSIDRDENKNEEISVKEDLVNAMNKKIAYTIINEQPEFKVAVSLPVVIEGEFLGIIRYIYDYKYLYDSSLKIFNKISIILLSVFGFVFILSVVLANKILKPIKKLKLATSMMNEGNFNHKVDIKTGDELQELADDFIVMKNTIRNRIVETEIERDNLIRMHKHRKLFFDNVTHELKTPLTVISGYTQLLENYDDIDKTFANKIIKNIKSETERMHRLVLDLLEAAKLESEIKYSFEKVKIKDVIDEVARCLRIKYYELKPWIGVECDENLELFVDKYRINQAISNLVDNSIKYAGDTVAKVNIVVNKNEKDVTITIEDNGQGIADENIDDVFKPFYKQKNSNRESYGLGLYITKTIVQRHGASMKIDSDSNGTKINIIFPI